LRAIRKHWMVESYHWHLDMTFRENANCTAEKQAAFNMKNIWRVFLPCKSSKFSPIEALFEKSFHVFVVDGFAQKDGKTEKLWYNFTG
jgi:hypothetical protein